MGVGAKAQLDDLALVPVQAEEPGRAVRRDLRVGEGLHLGQKADREAVFGHGVADAGVILEAREVGVGALWVRKRREGLDGEEGVLRIMEGGHTTGAPRCCPARLLGGLAREAAALGELARVVEGLYGLGAGAEEADGQAGEVRHGHVRVLERQLQEAEARDDELLVRGRDREEVLDFGGDLGDGGVRGEDDLVRCALVGEGEGDGLLGLVVAVRPRMGMVDGHGCDDIRSWWEVRGKAGWSGAG